MTVLLKTKVHKNKELTHACFSLLHILEALISGINDGLTDPFDGEPVEEDFKEGLQVGLPIVMEGGFLLHQGHGFTIANSIPAP